MNGLAESHPLMKPHKEAARIAKVGEGAVGRRFRAFCFATFAVACTGLIGSWFVSHKRVTPVRQVTTVASNGYDVRWYVSTYFNAQPDPPAAMLVLPEFFLQPKAEMPSAFGVVSNESVGADTDSANFYGEGSLPY